MLEYWLSVSVFAGHSTLDFLGKSKGGIFLDILILLGTIYRLYRKYGWAGMKNRLMATIVEGLAITLIASMLIYAWEFVEAPPALAMKDQEKIKSAEDKAKADEANISKLTKPNLIAPNLQTMGWNMPDSALVVVVFGQLVNQGSQTIITNVGLNLKSDGVPMRSGVILNADDKTIIVPIGQFKIPLSAQTNWMIDASENSIGEHGGRHGWAAFRFEKVDGPSLLRQGNSIADFWVTDYLGTMWHFPVSLSKSNFAEPALSFSSQFGKAETTK